MGELDIDNESIILKKYNLNPNELYLVKCIFYYYEDYDEYLHRYMELPENTRGKLRDLLISLMDKGIILKSYKLPKPGESVNLNTIPFSVNFKKDYYRASYELGNELFEAYPQFGWINGNQISIRTVASKFNSLEDAFRYYGKTINYKDNVHKEIIELVKWAKKQECLNMSLSSFIINRTWLDLKELKDGKVGNYNLEAVKLI